jgi:tRNA-specific adenosine deaminase 1
MPKIDNFLKRNLDDENCPDTEKTIKKLKESNESSQDIHRTGAKCLKSSKIQDPKEKGVNYHILGVSRTKPGRGNPTKSMSCSDKIAKWSILGIQGSLLSLLIDRPIYLNAIIVAK